MQGMCHYAEVLKRNLVHDKQPPGHAASPDEPATSKSSSPLQNTPPKPYKPKNKVTVTCQKKNRPVVKNSTSDLTPLWNCQTYLQVKNSSVAPVFENWRDSLKSNIPTG